jgi:hypothetical protein
MTHTEHEEMATDVSKKECCGSGACCDEAYDDCDDCCDSGTAKVGYILQRVFLGGAFVCSLLTLLLLPKIIGSVVKKQLVAEQALKAGGIENYEKLNKEIYNTADYKELMKQQVDIFIEQNKAQIEAFKQKDAPQTQEEVAPVPAVPATGAAATVTTSTGTAK